MSEQKHAEGKRTHYVECGPMRCYMCKHIFTQRLQIGEYPFCPQCGSGDVVRDGEASALSLTVS